ncbi:hypothetical protein [Luteimonas dalianensis]
MSPCSMSFPSRGWRCALPALAAALALAGCDPAPTADTDPHLQPVPEVARGGNAFQVRVTLSDAARAAVGETGEAVVVSADYFGYPSVSAQQRQLPGTSEPWLQLASHQVAADGEGVAEFAEVALDPEALQMVEEGRPHLRVEVYSQAGGEAVVVAIDGDDNLLDCGTYQGTLAAAARDGVDIDCKLIAE